MSLLLIIICLKKKKKVNVLYCIFLASCYFLCILNLCLLLSSSCICLGGCIMDKCKI